MTTHINVGASPKQQLISAYPYLSNLESKSPTPKTDVYDSQTIIDPTAQPYDAEATPLAELGVTDTTQNQGNIKVVQPWYGISHHKSAALWAYIVIVVIVVVIIFSFVADRLIDGWYDKLKKPLSLPIKGQLWVWVLMFSVLVVVAYFSHVWATDDYYRQWLTWIFLGNQILVVVWFLFFFGNKNVEVGYYFAIFTFLSAVVWWFMVYKVDRSLAWLLSLYVFWLGYLVVEQSQIFKANGKCSNH